VTAPLPARRRRRRIGWALGALATVAAVVALVAVGASSAYRARARKAPIELTRVFGDVPWVKLVPQLAPVDGVGGVRASDCGKCHQRHYDEWRRSTHANAWHDLQFQSELGKPTSPRWLCLNCHTPVENQRDVVVRALERGQLDAPIPTPNPKFDPAMRDEGVTCATCHVRQDERGRSYIIGSIGGDTKPPHPVRIDRAALLDRCADCHDQSHTLTPKLVCAFETGREVRASAEPDRACASCHLPEEERPLTTLGTPPRRAHRHTFVGGPVPKRFELYDEQLAGVFRSALDINYDVAPPDAGGRVAVTVTLTNARAAHRVPTGDPERYLLVEAALLDERGVELARDTLRIGQTWEWEPAARRKSDDRIAPGESRTWQARLTPPAGPPAGRPARVRVSARHVRLSPENLAYMKKTASSAAPELAPAIAALDKNYPTETTFYESEAPLDGRGPRTTRTQAELFERARRGLPVR
jgi:hypothetical protein